MTRQRLILAGAAVLAMLGSFGVGRYSRPERIVTKDVVHVETRTVEVAKTVTVHDAADVKDTAEKVRTVTVVRTRWLPGGVVERDATTQAATDTTAKETRQEHATQALDRVRQIDLKSSESHESERSAARPNWSVSLLPGVQFAGSKAVGIYGPAVLGASVDHRFIGPVFLGAWGSTSGAAGISIRGEF